MSGSRRIAAVIPAFNEAATLPDIVRRTAALADAVWVVDDGSTDETPLILPELPCRVLAQPRNTGKGASLRAGLMAATVENPDAIITLDADGQHAPETISELVARHEDTGADLVIAARVHQRRVMPPLRRFGNRFADFWVGLAGRCRLRDSQSGFRLYSQRLLLGLPVNAIPGNRFDFEGRVLIESCRRRFPKAEVAIAASYPPSGMTSHYHPIWDTTRIIGMVAWQILSRGPSLVVSRLRRLRRYFNDSRTS
jgi:glycosyltransferase involved in cell wall biosynthesis